MAEQYKITFSVSKEDYDRGQKLPRTLNVSEEMRRAYRNLLGKNGV